MLPVVIQLTEKGAGKQDQIGMVMASHEKQNSWSYKWRIIKCAKFSHAQLSKMVSAKKRGDASLRWVFIMITVRNCFWSHENSTDDLDCFLIIWACTPGGVLLFLDPLSSNLCVTRKQSVTKHSVPLKSKIIDINLKFEMYFKTYREEVGFDYCIFAYVHHIEPYNFVSLKSF